MEGSIYDILINKYGSFYNVVKTCPKVIRGPSLTSINCKIIRI